MIIIIIIIIMVISIIIIITNNIIIITLLLLLLSYYNLISVYVNKVNKSLIWSIKWTFIDEQWNQSSTIYTRVIIMRM